MRSLSIAVVAGLTVLALIVGASYTSATPIVAVTATQAIGSMPQAIDPDLPEASTRASDVGTARRLVDIQSRGGARGDLPEASARASDVGTARRLADIQSRGGARGDLPEASTRASDVGTARRLADIESRGGAAAICRRPALRASDVGTRAG